MRESVSSVVDDGSIRVDEHIPYSSRRPPALYGLYGRAGPSRHPMTSNFQPMALGPMGELVKDVAVLLNTAPFFDDTWIVMYTPDGDMRKLWTWSKDRWVRCD
jgi:hypothetical protein